MGLTCPVGHICHHHKVVEHRVLRLWHHQWQLGYEVSFGIGGCLAAVYLVAIAAVAHGALVVVSAVAPPPEGSAAHHLIAHLGLLHGHSGIAHRRCLHADGVARLIGLLIFVKVHVECGAFILLHTYRVRVVVYLNRKHSRQPRRWQRKVYGSYTEVVGLSLFFAHQFPVGVTQFKFHGCLGANRLLYAVHHLIGHHRCMYRLSGSVDAAIGKYHPLLHVAIHVEEVIPVGAPHHGACLVRVGIGKHAAGSCHVLGGKHVLTLIVGHGQIGFLVAIALALLDFQVRALYRLSCCGVHHHVAYLSVRLRLGYGIEVGHVV